LNTVSAFSPTNFTMYAATGSENREKKRRSKDGCLACRVRKKRCDMRKPTCLACERNMLLCRWSGTSLPDVSMSRSSSPQERRRSSSCSFRADDMAMALARAQPAFASNMLERPMSSLLYQHFLEQTSNALSIQRGPKNAFLMTLPRLALHYPDTVLQSLLALSGVHYGNKADNAEVRATTWTHLGLTLRSLKHSLTTYASNPGGDPVPLLATTLVLCFIEVIYT
jgi:Fungal specific transcription factor domain/Fungal Zn(2)-Cys(6) binuclear cluster domain